MGSGLPDAGYFNPHSPCGERPGSPKAGQASSNFNPHSPCGERPETIEADNADYSFQSTLPLRGATAEMRHF